MRGVFVSVGVTGVNEITGVEELEGVALTVDVVGEIGIVVADEVALAVGERLGVLVAVRLAVGLGDISGVVAVGVGVTIVFRMVSRLGARLGWLPRCEMSRRACSPFKYRLARWAAFGCSDAAMIRLLVTSCQKDGSIDAPLSSSLDSSFRRVRAMLDITAGRD